MSQLKSITIIGGGLAGLTLGIALRRRGVPVTIWEAGIYPRHRVCGEFVCGQGQEALSRLGLVNNVKKAGGTHASTTRFFLGRAKSQVRQIEPAALCLSRFRMDRVFAECFQSVGGELRQNARWQGTTDIEGLVVTTGRKAQPLDGGYRWFGLKVHAKNIQLETDLEMHIFAGAYVGLCRLANSEVNVCGLFRTRPGAHEPPAKDRLRGMPDTTLHERLARAEFDDRSFCAVAGLCLRPQFAVGQAECRLGDALTMIAPVTGNGMSMAFEAADLAVDPLASYAQGTLSWVEARTLVAQACDRAFHERLAWASWLQRLMFLPPCQGRIGAMALSSDLLWRLFFARTR